MPVAFERTNDLFFLIQGLVCYRDTSSNDTQFSLVPFDRTSKEKKGYPNFKFVPRRTRQSDNKNKGFSAF